MVNCIFFYVHIYLDQFIIYLFNYLIICDICMCNNIRLTANLKKDL